MSSEYLSEEGDDRAWREKMLVQITRVGSNQSHMEQALRDYAAMAERRLAALEGAVFGKNGEAGLSEKVRGLSARWATAIAIVVFVAAQLSNYIFRYWMHQPEPSIRVERQVKP